MNTLAQTQNASKTPARATILRPALSVLATLTLITGLAYPLATTVVAQLTMPNQANGSLVVDENGKVVGSALIGQQFDKPGEFWGRLSATGNKPYDGVNSGGSNLGPSNPALIKAVSARIDALKKADPGNTRPIPVDLVTASGSGLDPDISLAAAYYQIPRVARVHGIGEAQLKALVDRTASRPLFGYFGEAKVNVLALNRALTKLH
ncbi:potassium-transporting ATPase subunit KdpC [Crenobacter sp. SG2305]|uniref:potassium-transporting ATPase subunit KdpC n=1 Tax=Crenobacter oryzisoli TaxID=3056844 RepID=UPI0025AA92E8|nr:potassium-transporting ATPase subunit KdpC [Crenobacter sp. SG2305]MDN0084699.1 potassium-transporting ATPase subunit KdpC [Crenobacter sp. SG2305]